MALKNVLLAILGVACFGSVVEADDRGPSFPCEHAKSYAEKTICATPELSAADRDLAEVYLTVSNQGGIDSAALRKDEDRWLAQVRDRCTNPACLRDAYAARKQELLDRSARAASPAAWDETRPFPVPPALWNEAKALVGTTCTRPYTDHKVFLRGFSTPKGFAPFIILKAGVTVVPAEKGGSRFAFLLSDPGETCSIADVVALPSPAQSNAFMSCHVDSEGLESSGFGMRRAGQKRPVGYWAVESNSTGKPRIERVPMDVLGVANDVICQEPEYTGGTFD